MCTYIQDIHIYIYTHIIASLAFPTAATAIAPPYRCHCHLPLPRPGRSGLRPGPIRPTTPATTSIGAPPPGRASNSSSSRS